MSKSRGKVVPLSSLKPYVEREQVVNKLTVIAEDTAMHEPLSIGDAPGCSEENLKLVLEKFGDVLSNPPGQTDIVPLTLLTETEVPICLPPYRILDKLLELVRKEILKLPELGIIEASTSSLEC